MSDIQNISRRGFLEGIISGTGLLLSIRLAPVAAWAEQVPAFTTQADQAKLHPSVYVGIDADGTVYLIAHRSEMGTGSRTSLPLVLAEELDADWSRVKIEQAIGDKRYGSQDTDGSHSIRDFYLPMREAGATARLMLVRAAAEEWQVPESECETEPHAVLHRKTGRNAGYAQLVAAASMLPVPQKDQLKFKPRSAWRYLGKGVPSYDLAGLCTGKAAYGMDAHVEGMLYASIEHPPVLGGKVKSFDQNAPLQVSGVRQLVQLEPFTPPHEFQPLGGIAVIADNTWAAFRGRKKLNVTWDAGPNASYDSASYKKQLQETARKPAKVAREQGNVEAEFAKAEKIVEAEYYVPHFAHASMEPPVALADFRDGRVTAWAPTQDPQAVQEIVSKKLGIPQDKVICHVTLLGGGFGRKSKPDYVAEAAILSKTVGRPVKVVWSREDDIRFDYYHAVSAMYVKASVDANGRPTAWLQRSVFPPIDSTFDTRAQYGSAEEMGMGWTDVPYDIPNFRAENGAAVNHVRIGWLRSVANIYHAFAVSSFADELAHSAGKDPLEYLLDLIGPPRVFNPQDSSPGQMPAPEGYAFDTGRLRRVIELAAEKAQWGKNKMLKGRGLGIAAHRSFFTYVATVVEVEITDKGELRIPRVDTALDAGTVVNQETTRAQFEGAAVFATSLARTGEITAKNGEIEQSNFDNYQVATMNDAPVQVNVHIVDSDAPPAGVGEPGVPPFAPALCNAIYAATGKRIRELPLRRANLGS